MTASESQRHALSYAMVEGQNAADVESVVSLAHRLGRQVVAEGVEDEATWTAAAREGGSRCPHRGGSIEPGDADYARTVTIAGPAPV